MMKVVMVVVMVVQIMMMILSLLKVVMVVEGGDGGPGPENGKSCTLVVLLGGYLQVLTTTQSGGGRGSTITKFVTKFVTIFIEIMEVFISSLTLNLVIR